MNKKLHPSPLKLLARCAKGLEIISACTQDALVPIQSLKYNQQHKKFNLFTYRYKWEIHHQQPQQKQGERVQSGLSFENVEKVNYAGFNLQKDAYNLLYLLAVQHLPPYIYIIFSYNAKIRLKSLKLTVKLKDSNTLSWPSSKPNHE